MNFNFILTLEELTLLKVADMLWTEECMKKLLSGNFVTDVEPYKYWLMKLDETVDDIISNMLLPKIVSMFIPETVKRKLLCITRRVGLQKVDWYFYHEQLLDIKKLPSRFYWTVEGCIDRQRTAEILVEDITIGVCKRYSLACFYCIEKEIHTLNGGNPHRCEKCSAKYGNELRDFWNRIIEQGTGVDFSDIEQNNERIRTFRDAYRYSLGVANNVGAEYFLKNATVAEYNLQERDEDSMYFFDDMIGEYVTGSNNLKPREQYFDVAFYLLKRMTENQQIKALRDHPMMKFTLSTFLRWPFHSLFFPAAETFRHYISRPDATYLLCKILKKEIELFEDFNYRDLFTEFWQMLPTSRKADIIISSDSSKWLLSSLLKTRHTKGLFMILGDVTTSVKEDLLLNEAGIETCETFALNEEWNLLKLFFDSCLPSRSRDLVLKFEKNLKYILPKNTITYILKLLEIEDV